jgi:AraC-like DNA-binding protein
MDLICHIDGLECAFGGSDVAVGSWHDVFRPVFEISAGSDAQGGDGFGAWATRAAAVSIAQHGPTDLVRDPRHAGARSFDQIAFRLILSGSIEIHHAGGTARAYPGSLLVFDLQRPFRLLYGEDGSQTSEMTLWLSPLRLRGIPDENVHGRLLSGTSAVAVFSSALQTLAGEAKRIGTAALGDVTDGIAGLAVNLLATGGAVSPPVAIELESFTTICSFIDNNLNARNLSPTSLARTFGLSRASLYRLFEPVGGVASYIRSRRLERVRDAIKEPGLMNRRIAPVAYGSGFKSIASFNRAYRQAFGETPRQSRGSPSCASPIGALDKRMGPLARCLLEID